MPGPMSLKEQLEDLNLFMENAVDQIGRCQRIGRGDDLGVERFAERIDSVFGSLVSLRNDVRDALMAEMAKGPKKLPTL